MYRCLLVLTLTLLCLSLVLTSSSARPIPVVKPKVVSRKEWGAREPKCKFERNPFYNAITIHHTATSNEYVDAKSVVRAIQRYHQDERKWCDIGYHFLIDKEGVIYEGRPLWAIGAHVRDHNKGNIGISLIGNYEEVDVNEKQIKALVDLVSWLVYEYKIPLKDIKGHRDYADTLCPGKYLYTRLPEIRRRVAQRVYGFGDIIGVAVWWGMYSEYWSSNREEWERQVDEALKNLKRTGINTIFFLAKDPWGYVYYRSDYAPLSPKYSWDLLEYVVKKAKEYGISVHVYINALSEGETRVNDFLSRHIEWAVRDSEGNPIGWVDPSADEYVQRLIKIVKELVRKYDIDGVQLDKIRVSEKAQEFPVSSEKFIAKYGVKPSQDPLKFKDFIARRVSEIVKRVYEAVKEENPYLRVSTAVMPDPEIAKETFYQDWGTWIKEGLVDFVIMMSYTSSLLTFKEYIDKAIKASDNIRPVYVGIGIYLDTMSAKILSEELSYAVKKGGVYGVCFFNTDTLIKKTDLCNVISEKLNELIRLRFIQEGPSEGDTWHFWLYVMLPATIIAIALIIILLKRS